MWADGKELDLSTVTYRLTPAATTQLPDSLIEAKEGAGNAPAYRGLAYIVFERMALADFGNRIPQLSFEVHRAVDPLRCGRARRHPDPRRRRVRLRVSSPSPASSALATNTSENVHTRQGGTDWAVSLDQLQATLPNVAAVSLVVGWFGTDLRAGHCEIRPGVDAADKVTEPLTWRVAGLDRDDAHLVSTDRRPRGLRRHAVGRDRRSPPSRI